jgi:hypothetical protein
VEQVSHHHSQYFDKQQHQISTDDCVNKPQVMIEINQYSAEISVRNNSHFCTMNIQSYKA